MSSLDGKNLLGSGPHRTHIGGLSLRHVLHASPLQGDRAVQLSPQGTPGRAMIQTGDLLADDLATLDALVGVIEQQLDGRAVTLVDELGRSWPQVVMLSFEPQSPRRVGTRWALAYRIQLLQVQP